MKGAVLASLALIVAGLVLGFLPVNVGDTDRRDGYSCGSAFVTSDDLTNAGHEYCLIHGGGANRRAFAFAALAAGAVLVLGGLGVSPPQGQPQRPSRESQLPPPTG